MTATEKQLYEYSDTKRRIRDLEKQIDDLEAKKAGVYDMLLDVKPPYGKSETVAKRDTCILRKKAACGIRLRSCSTQSVTGATV